MRDNGNEKMTREKKKPSKSSTPTNVDKPLRAIISITGTVIVDVDYVCNQIKEISQRSGVFIRGPIPLESKVLKVPCGDGADQSIKTIRTHRREIRVDADDRVMKQLMMIKAPESVKIKVDLSGA